MEQNIFDFLVKGLDLKAFYSFIESKTDFGNNPPELVFQYTTWGALFNGIIRSDEEDDKKVHVFSTNCQYMNDPKEVETGEQYIDMALQGFFGNCGECENDIRHRNAIYMTSFSENENSLPMWNMYGKNGSGVSIGFDLELLRRFSKGTIKKCLYDTPLNRTLFQATLSNEKSNGVVNSGDKFQQYLMTLMDFAKKGCYEYENEVRLTRQVLETPEYRLSENFIVPYVDNIYPKEIIKKIIIGPCNDFDRSTKSLQGWLYKIGMDHVKVTYSMLPYRNS